MSDAPQIGTKKASEVRNAAVDFSGKLDSGESLTGTPTVTATPSGLTFANVAVSTGTLTINGSSVAAGKAVQFKVTGGTSYLMYDVSVSCGTNSTPAQTLYACLQLMVEPDC